MCPTDNNDVDKKIRHLRIDKNWKTLGRAKIGDLANPEHLQTAFECLAAGEVLLIRSGNLMGIICRSDDKKALKRLHNLKKEPQDKKVVLIAPFSKVLKHSHPNRIHQSFKSIIRDEEKLNELSELLPGFVILRVPVSRDFASTLPECTVSEESGVHYVHVLYAGTGFPMRALFDKVEAEGFRLVIASWNIHGQPEATDISSALKYHSGKRVIIVEHSKDLVISEIRGSNTLISAENLTVVREGATPSYLINSMVRHLELEFKQNQDTKPHKHPHPSGIKKDLISMSKRYTGQQLHRLFLEYMQGKTYISKLTHIHHQVRESIDS